MEITCGQCLNTEYVDNTSSAEKFDFSSSGGDTYIVCLECGNEI